MIQMNIFWHRLTDIENRLVTKIERVWGKEGLGVWDYQLQTSVYRLNKQQKSYCIAQGTTLSYDKPYGKEYEKIYMYNRITLL